MPADGGASETGMTVFGDTLRQARASKGLTLKEAEQATRINRHYLTALEEENFGVLPSLIYQRGIVRNYASYLELDPGKLLAMFEGARGGDGVNESIVAVKPLDMPNHWAPNFAIIAFMVVMSAIVFSWAYSALYADPNVTSTAPPVPPTVTPMDASQLELPSPTAVAVVDESQASATARVISSRTEAPPTVTPMPTPRAIATTPPTATAVPRETPSPTAERDVAAAEDEEPANEEAAQEVDAAAAEPVEDESSEVAPDEEVEAPAAAQGEGATIRIIAQSDIQVTVTADDVVVFSGWLGKGSMTEWFTASRFAVTTSNGSVTLFENPEIGDPFYMGYGENETYYLG